MLTEIVLRRIAIGCAVFQLLGPLGGRTMWVKGHVTATDAAGYNAAAVVSGVVALAALAVALWARPRVVLSLLGAAMAIAAFGLSVVAAGVDMVARWQGQVWVYAAGSMSDGGKGWTIHPAPGPPVFASAALIGAVATLTLAMLWLRAPSAT